MAGLMSRSSKPSLFVPLVFALACGPEVASPGADTDAEDTDAEDTEGEDTEGGDTEGGDTEGGDTEPTDDAVPQTRVLYPTEEGLMARDFVDGELSPAELVVSGQWTDLSVDGDKFKAREVDDGPGLLFGDGASTPPVAVQVDCPVDSGCWSAVAGDARFVSERTFSQDASPEHYLVDGDELVPLYTSEPGGFVGVYRDYLVALETTSAGTQLVRVPAVPGGQVEALLEIGPTFSVSATSSVIHVRSQSDIIWFESFGFVDITADPPTLLELPLLEGRTLHGLWASAGPAHHDGMFVIQGDGEFAADLAWIPLTGGKPGGPVLVSNGSIERKVSHTASVNPILVSPGQQWVALKTKLSPESSTGSHLVPRNGTAFGEPISLGERTSVVHFSADDGEVFFWTFGEGSVSLSRAELDGGVLGVPSLLFEFEELSNSTFAEDSSTVVAVEGGESDALWILDLSDPGASPRHVPECGAVNIFANISADGSLVSCSSGEDFTQDREQALVDVRGGSVIALVDAVDMARFVTIDAP